MPSALTSVYRFQLPALQEMDEAEQLGMIKEASSRHGVRAKLKGDEIFREDLKQAPRFLLKMESYPKVRNEERMITDHFSRSLLARESTWRHL